MASGRGQQRTVTKVYGPNSQQLEQMAAENQLLREVVIAFPAGGGGRSSGATGMGAKSKAAQKLVLKNAQITQIVQTRNVQQISLTYQAIEVTYTSGGTTAADDWETP
jgi:type VI protein secretion system component Hcp